MLLNELFEMRDPKQAAVDAALAALHRRVQSKGDLQNIGGYAFDISRSFNVGLSSRELADLYIKKYGANESWSAKQNKNINEDTMPSTQDIAAMAAAIGVAWPVMKAMIVGAYRTGRGLLKLKRIADKAGVKLADTLFTKEEKFVDSADTEKTGASS